MKNIIEPNFKLGDCVQLPSGGNKLTVTHLCTRPNMQNLKQPLFTGYVECSWFEENPLNLQSLSKGNFHQEALKLCSTQS